jgi:hypothetical protein
MAAPPMRQPRPNARRPGNADASRDRSMRADHAVVADLDLVVELDALLDDRIVDGAAVDGRVRADLDIRADDDAPDLRNLVPPSVLIGKPEAVGSDDRATVDQRARTDDATGIERHVRLYDGIVRERRVVAQDDVCAEHASLADDRTGADHGEGTDRRGRRRCAQRHRRRRCDARRGGTTPEGCRIDATRA